MMEVEFKPMQITDHDMTVYDFGEKRIWPKPELKTAFDALRWHSELVDALGRMAELANGNQRQDHFIQHLDMLAFSLRESLFRVMVLRESITGFATRDAQRDKI
jgi:hypothetical protein